MNKLTRVFSPLLLFVFVLSLSSCDFDLTVGPPMVAGEQMVFDSLTNLRYQNIKWEQYGVQTDRLRKTYHVNVLDSYQLPDTFNFETDNLIDIHIPFLSQDGFYFETAGLYNPQNLVERTDIDNATNSRDARKDGRKSFCIRYNSSNGKLEMLNHSLQINIYISKFLELPNIHGNTLFSIIFWDELDDIEDFDFKTFDGANYIDTMIQNTESIRSNKLISVVWRYEDGSEVDSPYPFHCIIDYSYFHYGPRDPTYEIVV